MIYDFLYMYIAVKITVRLIKCIYLHNSFN